MNWEIERNEREHFILATGTQDPVVITITKSCLTCPPSVFEVSGGGVWMKLTYAEGRASCDFPRSHHPITNLVNIHLTPQKTGDQSEITL